MNLMQELRGLDPRDPGRWPFAVRALTIAICFVVVATALIYFFVWQSRMPELQQREDKEAQLRSEFRSQACQGGQSGAVQAAVGRHRKVLRCPVAAIAQQN